MKRKKIRFTPKFKRLLKRWWEKRSWAYDAFKLTEAELEKQMFYQHGKRKIPLEFIYDIMSEECVGIGARDFKDKKIFPLIHIEELES
jgi:hypothetical protein